MGLLLYILYIIVKYTIFLQNLLYTIFGFVLILLGVLLHFKLVNYSRSDGVVNDEELEAEIESASTLVFIVWGCVLFFIAFTGCCGAVTETKCLLVTYAVTMFVLLTAKIILSVWILNTNSLRHTAKGFINNVFDKPAHNVTKHLTEVTFGCCGKTGPDSYKVLPPSCCARESDKSIRSVVKPCLLENAFSIGCLELVDDIIVANSKTLKIVFIVLIIFQILEFVAAVYLCIAMSYSED